MDKRAVKCKQRCVDQISYLLQLTCLIHGPGHSSDEYKVLNYFGTKYSKVSPFKESSQSSLQLIKVWKEARGKLYSPIIS